MPKNQKTSLKEFNVHEVRGWVIDEMIHLEWLLDRIICEHFQIKEKLSFEVGNSTNLNKSLKTIYYYCTELKLVPKKE